MSENLNVFIDESGNMGNSGRYFTIAAITCSDVSKKLLRRYTKKCSNKTKKTFYELPKEKMNIEIKAAKCCGIIKDFYLRKICKSGFRIYYITADLRHITSQSMLENRNLLYNYLLNFLIQKIIKDNNDLKEINLKLDNRDIKVGSANSFEDYIKIKIIYEMGMFNINLNVDYIDSSVNYCIQAADFIANTINGYYLKSKSRNCSYLYNLIKDNLNASMKFPLNNFGC